MKTDKWNLNMWTGNHYYHVDNDITVWRMAGNAPYLYWATAFALPGSPRTGARKTPKAAIEALRKLIAQGGAK